MNTSQNIKSNTLFFPSGRSIGNCRKDAKKLSRTLQVPLHSALNTIAHDNGLSMPWHDAVQSLQNNSNMGVEPIMTIIDIDKILDDFPRLSHFGFGVFQQNKYPLNDYLKELAVERESLRNALDECNKACLFLTHIEKRRSINYDSSSYGLKHQAEYFLKQRKGIENPYIANGAFICAAIFMGFDVKEDQGPNVCFNISSKSPVLKWRSLSEKTHFLSSYQRSQLKSLETQLQITSSRENF